jgi:hypothetical protein
VKIKGIKVESRRFHTFVLMVLHKQHFFGAECQRQIGPAILSDASEGNQDPVGTGWLSLRYNVVSELARFGPSSTVCKACRLD